MALQPTTGLENHPVNTANLNGILNANWARLEAIFAPLGAAANGHSLEWDAANEKFVLRPGPQTLTDAASISWDMAAGNIAAVTLAGNRTLGNPTNKRPGTSILRVKQDATGGRELALGTDYRTAGGAGITLTAAANATDILTFVNFGDGIYHAAATLNLA